MINYGFQRIVRFGTAEYMGMGRYPTRGTTPWSASDFPPPPYKPHKYAPDGVRKLTLAWDHPVNHPYNRAAAENFADAIVKHPRYGPRIGHIDKDKITETFMGHAVYLYRKRKDLLKQDDVTREKKLKAKAVDRRRKTVRWEGRSSV